MPWQLIAFIAVVPVITGTAAYVSPPDDGSPVGLIVAISLLPLLLVLAVRLTTEVRAEGLTVRLSPLTTRRIGWPDITAASPRTYRPLREYGGWGIRFGKAGTAYNARGNRGLQLVLTGGERFLIGSQQPEALLAAITAASRREYPAVDADMSGS